MDGLYFIFRRLRATFLTAYILEEEKRPLRLFTKNDLFSIMESLMEHVSDIPMLFGLVFNFSAARDLYMNNPRRWLHIALQGAPDEFKPIMVALIVSHQSVPNDEETMNLFLDEYVDSYSPNPVVPAAIEHPVGVLHKLCDAYDVEKFLRPMLVSAIQKLDKPRCFGKSWIARVLLAADAKSSFPRRPDFRHIAELGHRFKDKMPRDGSWPKKLPISDLELYRIKRAILRYEIYYALFHRQDKTWLLESQCKFFSKLTPWEVEELATIHQHAKNLLPYRNLPRMFLPEAMAHLKATYGTAWTAQPLVCSSNGRFRVRHWSGAPARASCYSYGWLTLIFATGGGTPKDSYSWYGRAAMRDVGGVFFDSWAP